MESKKQVRTQLLKSLYMLKNAKKGNVGRTDGPMDGRTD